MKWPLAAGDPKGEEYRRLNRYLDERLDTLYEQGEVADEEWGADYIRSLLELTEQQIESAPEPCFSMETVSVVRSLQNGFDL